MVEELSDNKIEIKKEIMDGSDFKELTIATDKAIHISKPSSTQIKVFDLGATTHISPYHNGFSTFEFILP